MAKRKKSGNEVEFIGNLPVYYDNATSSHYLLFPNGVFFCTESLCEVTDKEFSKLDELHRTQTLVGNFELMSDLPDFMKRIAKKILMMQSELRKAD